MKIFSIQTTEGRVVSLHNMTSFIR